MKKLTVLTQTDIEDVPVAQAWNGRGPVFEVGADERVLPEACDHEGYSSSSVFRLRCGRCGAPMVLHRLLIAHRTLDEIAEMERAWGLAGKPDWRLVTETVGGKLGIVGIGWDEEETAGWVRVDHPLFVGMGGLPMRPLPAPRKNGNDNE